jgi:hypothetical protein
MHYESELSAGGLSLFPLQLQGKPGAAAAIRGGAAIAVAAAKPIGPPSLVIHGLDSYIIIIIQVFLVVYAYSSCYCTQ